MYPRISFSITSAGTSPLKGVVEQHGYTCTVKDANFELLDAIDDEVAFEAINYFTIPNSTLQPPTQTDCRSMV